MNFGEILRRERGGRSVQSIVKGVSVPERTYRGWEDGTDYPTRAEFGKLCLQLPRMRHYPPSSFAERSPSARSQEAREDAAKKKQGFGLTLREEREAEGMDQEELGALLGVTGQAVSQWELEAATPVRENYEALVLLFPRLREAPEPDWKDIAIPDGGRGVSRCATEDIMSETSSPLSAAAPDPAERVILAYQEVYGGSWYIKVSRGGESPDRPWRITADDHTCRVPITVDGRSVVACYDVLLAKLDEEIDRRIAELESLRASMRRGR